jgi:hypothetical protein
VLLASADTGVKRQDIRSGSGKPSRLSFLPRLAAAFIRHSRSNSRRSLRWERTWDQILGNGVVDRGMPPRPCGARRILGSHPPRSMHGIGGRAVLRGRSDFYLPRAAGRRGFVDCWEGRANKGQEARN